MSKPNENPNDVKESQQQSKDSTDASVNESIRDSQGQFIRTIEGHIPTKGTYPNTERRMQKLKELQSRRDTKELSPYPVDLSLLIQLNDAGLPLTRKDMLHESGNQVVVLTRDDFDELGVLDFIHVSGEQMLIEAESLHREDIFILYPEEVAE